MGANIKELRVRIKSVDSTLHLTKAMGLVASSKIRRASEAMIRSREYARAVQETVDILAASSECQKSVYMQKRDGKRSRVILIAGDRGLAGGYNANVFRLAATLSDVDFIPIGKRAYERFPAGELITAETFSLADAMQLARLLCSDFASGEFDRLGILSTRYVSMLTQEAEISWLLPFAPKRTVESHGMIFEPDELHILNAAIPEYVAGILTAAVRESFACEVAARRMAMDSAGKNAQQMIDNLQLAYNRARQGAITQEITEIVAGSGM